MFFCVLFSFAVLFWTCAFLTLERVEILSKFNPFQARKMTSSFTLFLCRLRFQVYRCELGIALFKGSDRLCKVVELSMQCC